MLKNVIRLPDGTSISSGADSSVAIQSCTITECVNSGSELTVGSTCSACLEAHIISTSGALDLPAGEEIELYKADETGAMVQAGVFRLESPTRKSDNVYKITAFDRVCLLDKDLSAWLKGLTGWPYTLSAFATMACAKCGLSLQTGAMLNADFPVQQFYKSGVTGRQIMRWIGEIAGCFCCATPEGKIELAWYSDSAVTVTASGSRYYFAGALTYEDFDVAAIDAVKLRLADSSDGALWPDGAAKNPYTITGNAILLAKVSEDLLPYLEVIRARLAALPAYKPCKVSLPAGLDIRAGNTVQIADKHGNQLTALVMTKTQSGQRDTLECTGSQNRSSTTAANSQSAAQLAQEAVASQTQQDIFNKLTKNGTIQGIYVQDDKWYINAEQVNLQNLKVKAADVTGVITVKDAGGDVLFSAGDGAVTIAGWSVDDNSFFSGSTFANSQCFFCTGSNTEMSIGGSDKISGWVIKAGSNFGVTSTGALYANDVNLTGVINANSGKIGDWTIADGGKLYGEYWGYGVTLHPQGIAIDYASSDGPHHDVLYWKDLIDKVNAL